MSARIPTLFDQDFAPKSSYDDLIDKSKVMDAESKIKAEKPLESETEGSGVSQETSELPVMVEYVELPDLFSTDNISNQGGVSQLIDSGSGTDKINDDAGTKSAYQFDKATTTSGGTRGASSGRTKTRIKKVVQRVKVVNEPAKEQKDNGEEKHYHTIGEVATMFQVNTSHIRFWTNEFQLNVRTTRKGDRLFTKENIAELRNIHHLVKEKGYTLAGAKTQIKDQKRKHGEKATVKKSLLVLRESLLEMRKRLNQQYEESTINHTVVH